MTLEQKKSIKKLKTTIDKKMKIYYKSYQEFEDDVSWNIYKDFQEIYMMLIDVEIELEK